MSARVSIALACVAAALAPGCANTADKAGGEGEPRVLGLANANFQPDELQVFADEVERRSNGALRIAFANEWRRDEVGAERGIVDDVKAGKAELGWVGARAFPALGVHEFDALLAPLLVDDYALEQEAIERLGQQMLDGVEALGVQPVALLPGPMRRLVAREPVTRPEDLAGRTLMLQRGAIEEAAARALGAEPIGGPSGAKLGNADGTVQHLGSIAGNRYEREAPYLTADLGFWPRPLVVIASPEVWERLSAAQRSVLLDSGRAAIGPTVAAIRERDAAATEEICSEGARFVRAGSTGRAAMLAALEPVYADLRKDPSTARAIAVIDGMRGSSSADRAPRCGTPVPEQVAQEDAIPAGTYVYTLTRDDTSVLDPGDDLARARMTRFRGVFTPGHLVLYESSDGAPEQIGLEADYSVYRDHIEFEDAAGGTMTMRWSLDGGRLRFTDVDGPGPGDDVVFASQPWVRVR